MATNSPYHMYLYVGDNKPDIDGAYVADVTPDTADITDAVQALRASGLSGADLRSQTVFLTDAGDNSDIALKACASYAALIGLAGRRVDVAFGEGYKPVVMASVDRSVKALGDAGKPAHPHDLVIIDNGTGEAVTDIPQVNLAKGLNDDVVRLVRHSRNALLRISPDPQQALPELVLVSAMRAKHGMERLPAVTLGDNTVDCEQARRLGDALRRESRSDDRTALADELPEPPRQYAHMQAAAATPVTRTLEALGAHSKVVVKDVELDDGTIEQREQILWHCLHPSEHTNNDASPSARVTVLDNGTSYYRCFRCLKERVDSLRLVMWALGCTGDEAADWVAQNC